MRDTSSRTAEFVCLARAAERTRRSGHVIMDDPYAARFLTLPGHAVLRAFGARTGPLGLDALSLGVSTFVVARHATMDRWIREEAPARVILLGAGFDSRAWRLGAELKDTVFIEIDHPATAARKTHGVRDLPPAHRTTLQVDLARQPLAPLLEGLDPLVSTVVVWEGVAMYLDRPTVLATLRTLGHHLPNATLLMDLWSPQVGGALRTRWVEAQAKIPGLVGEPITFSLPPGGLAPLASEAGARVLELLDREGLQASLPLGRRPLHPAAWVARLQLGQ